jgi:hypothetical protein
MRNVQETAFLFSSVINLLELGFLNDIALNLKKKKIIHIDFLGYSNHFNSIDKSWKNIKQEDGAEDSSHHILIS